MKPLPAGELRVGPVQCAWRPFHPGTPAEPLVRGWLVGPLVEEAGHLALHRDAYGRPSLGTPHTGHDVSWSHSGAGLLMALGTGVRLGIDLEFRRPRPRALELAARFFAEDEARTLSRLPLDEVEPAFVRLWCAKEAVLKAHGKGLSFGLHRLRFVPSGEDWRLVECDVALGRPADWTLYAFDPAPDYRATIAWRAA